MSELLEYFQIEAAERLERLGAGLLALEQNKQDEKLLQDLFREAHSLKGAAAVSGLEHVATVCHRLEDVLARIRDGALQPDSRIVDTLLAATDAVRELVNNPELSEERSREIVEQLSEALHGSGPSPERPSPPRASSEGEPATESETRDDQKLDQRAEPPQQSAAPQEPHVELPSKSTPHEQQPASSVSSAGRPTARQAQPVDQTPHVVPSGREQPRPSASEEGSSTPDTQTAAGEPRRAVQSAAPAGSNAGETPRASAPSTTSASGGSHDALHSRQQPASTANGSAEQRFVRLKVEDLDRLTNVAGELFVAGNRLRSRLNDLRRLRRQILQAQQWSGAAEELLSQLQHAVRTLVDDLSNDLAQVSPLIGEVHQRTLEARMVPVDSLFASLPRLVRQMCRETGKQAELQLSGGQARIDRQVLEALRDPLIHLVRNAVAHGIEPPEQREASGKPRVGRIRLWAERRGERIRLVCEDDGRGIDRPKLVRRAVEAGLLSAEQAQKLSPKQIDRLILLPGLSTADSVTDLCGRGVGMDVVAQQVARLHGTLKVHSEPGRFTRFEIELPASVATLEGLVVEANGHTYVLPAFAVRKTLRIEPSQVRRGAGGEWLCVLDGQTVPLVTLLDLLWPGTHAFRPAGPRAIAVLVKFGSSSLAIVVDRLVGMKTVVAKSLGNHLGEIDGIVGATILPNGQPALIVNPQRLAELWVQDGRSVSVDEVEEGTDEGQQRQRPPVLVVDDSVTTRMMEKSILESAGYRVDTAVNGEQAWSKLGQQTYALVVTDVEMPGLDGFELTKRIRSHKELKDLPVIIVTSLGTPEQKKKGMEAGANAYIVKKEFDQSRLLDLVARMAGS